MKKKWYWVIGIIVVAMILISILILYKPFVEIPKENDVSKHCRETFEITNECPEDLCEFGCVGGEITDGCARGCIPKGCLQDYKIECNCIMLGNCPENSICYSTRDCDL